MKTIESLINLSNQYIEQSRFVDALNLLEMLVTQGNSSSIAFNGLGHVYFCLGRLEDALRAFQSAISIDPTRGLAHQNLGYIYSDLEHYDEAIVSFERAISLEPKNARPYHGLGLVYGIINNLDYAIDTLQYSSQLDSSYVGPCITLAGIYNTLGQHLYYQEYIQRIEPLLENQKYYTRSRFSAVCHNTEDALEWLEKAIIQAPGYRWTARNAIDLKFIRRHPRFKSLIGEAL